MTIASPTPAAAKAPGARAFPWAEDLFPQLLKSPWWIGHIPFAFELVGRLRPRVLVELGTYSGSSFAAFCQAMQACGIEGRCYGIDLWEGDVHMGKFDETLYREIADYLAAHYPGIATLVRKDFNARLVGFRRRIHRPAAHRRHAYVRGGEQRFPYLASEDVGAWRGALPRRKRERARTRARRRPSSA